MERNVAAAERAMAYGIRTVVDATTNECGRDPILLKELSQRTGLHILCATGYYYESESAFAYWNFRSSFTDIEEEIAQMMAAELTEGIGGTGVRAGVIKLASSEGWMTPICPGRGPGQPGDRGPYHHPHPGRDHGYPAGPAAAGAGRVPGQDRHRPYVRQH